MDRKKAKQLFGSITVVIILISTFLCSRGTISELACIIIFLSALALCTGLYFYTGSNTPDSTELNEQKLHRKYKKKNVQRTREGNFFELATVLILAVSLFIGFVNHTFELRSSILEGYMFFFIGAIAELVIAYYPLFVTVPSSDLITNDEQFKLLIRKHRVIAIIFALMTLTCSVSSVENHLQTLIFIFLTIALFGTVIVFSFLHNKNK